MARKTKITADVVGLTQHTNPAAENPASYEAVEAQSRSRCGGALRAARESQGLSIHDIASRLRLSPKQIEAMEADNFASLPEPTIVRGFIRNYAKQLKINVEPLLDAYNVIVPSATPHDLIVKSSARMKMSQYEKPKTGSYIWAALAVLLGLGAWLFYQNYIEKPSPIAPTANVETLEPLPEPALPAAERLPELQTATELTLPPADASLAPPPADATVAQTLPLDASASNAAPVAVAPVPVVPAPIVPATATLTPVAPIAAPPLQSSVVVPVATIPNGTSKLEISATQETWVNVVDASGREVYSKVIFAGSRESIDVKLPANVTVGNAGATSLNMNGKVIELAPYSRNNVAHIKLE